MDCIIKPLELAQLYDKELYNANNLDCTSRYFFNYDGKIAFVKKSRGLYKVCVSGKCPDTIKRLYSESCFDVVFTSPDFSEASVFFKWTVHKIFGYSMNQPISELSFCEE